MAGCPILLFYSYSLENLSLKWAILNKITLKTIKIKQISGSRWRLNTISTLLVTKFFGTVALSELREVRVDPPDKKVVPYHQIHDSEIF